MHDAKEELVRAVEGVSSGDGASADEIAESCQKHVSDLILEDPKIDDALTEMATRGADKALAQAFNLDDGQNAREVLRSDFAQALRHALQHDDIVRAALADVIGAEIANGIKAALRDALPVLREAVRNGIELHEAEKAQGAPDREV